MSASPAFAARAAGSLWGGPWQVACRSLEAVSWNAVAARCVGNVGSGETGCGLLGVTYIRLDSHERTLQPTARGQGLGWNWESRKSKRPW